MLTPFGPSFGEGFASIPTAKLIIEYSFEARNGKNIPSLYMTFGEHEDIPRPQGAVL